MIYNYEYYILGLIPGTTVTSLSAPKDTRCKTHSIPVFLFECVRKKSTSCARAGIHADVTVVLEVRRSIVLCFRSRATEMYTRYMHVAIQGMHWCIAFMICI